MYGTLARALLRNGAVRKLPSQSCCVVPLRHLNLQEYQSKELMVKYGINTQKFRMAETPQQADRAVKELNVVEVVVKAQILAGGRGKGVFSSGLQGGVKVTKDLASVKDLTSKMFGYKLKTKQTTGDGVLVQKVMVAEALDIARECYFAIVLDRTAGGVVLVGSPRGGVDIEELAETAPEAIHKELVADFEKGPTDQQVTNMAKFMGFEGAPLKEAVKQIHALYKMFLGVDATQVEINPFGETPDKRVVCFDAKINFDDNAKFRQKEIFDREDTSESDPREVEATKYNLSYIGMSGNIGCLVNGAGLAMATMDIIKLHKGEPANFLDVGGGASEDQVKQAFRILTMDPQVKAILVNIFGGIVNCATIANGIIKACKDTKLALPLIVRLEGTNVDKAREILRNSGLAIMPASDLTDAAQKAVASL